MFASRLATILFLPCLNACTGGSGTTPVRAIDCADVQKSKVPVASSVVQVSLPSCATCPKKTVLCDFSTDGGGWTVIQQRSGGSENFFTTWENYKNGFGTVTDLGDFYIGNEYIAQLTSSQPYELRIDATSRSGQNIVATYSSIRLLDEAQAYTLGLGNPVSNPSVTDNMASARNRPFGTFDRDTDSEPAVTCGAYWNSGWWYEATCAEQADLNAPYRQDPRFPQLTGIRWDFGGTQLTLQTVKMMVRPVGFSP